MPRINHVNKARKDQGTCTCGAAVRKGDSYKWIKPRYGSKQIRCDNCHFRDSDLTSSDKLARCYDARDNALDQLGGWSNEDSVDDLRNIVEDMTSELREVAEEYQQSADNIRDSFTESSTADECEERANEIEGWAEEVESAVEDIEEFDEDEKKEEEREDVEDDARSALRQLNPAPATRKEIDSFLKKFIDDELAVRVEQAREEWADEARNNLENAISNCPV